MKDFLLRARVVVKTSKSGSLRIEDFCTTMPFGHVISCAAVLYKLEFTILSEHDDDVGGRAANFSPLFKL